MLFENSKLFPTRSEPVTAIVVFFALLFGVADVQAQEQNSEWSSSVNSSSVISSSVSGSAKRWHSDDYHIQETRSSQTSEFADDEPTLAAGRQDWDIPSVLRELDRESEMLGQSDIQEGHPWWTEHVVRRISPDAKPIHVNVGDLIMMAVSHSAKINVARGLPLIRETAITDAQSAFDWNQFIDAMWTDTSEPIGSSLTVGANSNADRFREHNFSIDAGVRRKLFNGADFQIYQRMGHRSNNSSFFIPNDQATSRIALGFTQPLLRGRGEVYNTSLILLAEIDTGSANDEFHRQLQSHLLEVARGYWALYLERTNLAQKVSLYLKTRSIAEQLNSRANIDAQRTQVISANAALESRKSDLIRSRAAVKNAETRLRALLNSPMLTGDPDTMEMIPDEHPTTVVYPAEMSSEFEIALQNRPEIAAALKGVRAASIRLNMAAHEILPLLNVVTETYVSGLRGESDIGNAWLDQYRRGEPSYSVGLQYEIPLGRRAAFSNQKRRQVEIHQLREQYRATLELIRAEVEVAVREMQTAHRELHARNRSRQAAEAEASTLEARWQQLGDRGGTGGLLLESLLRAQERVTQFEYEFAKAQMTYNLALINLRHANGTLYQAHTGDGGASTEHGPDQYQPAGQPIRYPEFYPSPIPHATPPKDEKYKIPDDEPIIYNQRRYQLPESRSSALQQANVNWGQPANRSGSSPGSHPLLTGEETGLTYNEMIGRPAASQARLKEDDWRNKIVR